MIPLVRPHILGQVLLPRFFQVMLPLELRLQLLDLLPQLPDLFVLRSRGRPPGVLLLGYHIKRVLLDVLAFDGEVLVEPGELGLHHLIAVVLVVPPDVGHQLIFLMHVHDFLWPTHLGVLLLVAEHRDGRHLPELVG